MARQPHARLCFLRYLDFGRVEPGIQRCTAAKASARPRSADVLQHDFVAGQWFAGPIGADMTEEAMFNPIPLRRTGRVVRDRNGQAGLIGQALQLPFPSPVLIAVGATAIGLDQQFGLVSILASTDSVGLGQLIRRS